MDRLATYVKSLVRRDEGQDLIEYALLVGLITLVAVVAVTAAGTSVNELFQSVADSLAAAV